MGERAVPVRVHPLFNSWSESDLGVNMYDYMGDAWAEAQCRRGGEMTLIYAAYTGSLMH